MNSKSYKLTYLKDNIRMRVICLCWEDLITHWSNNSKAFTPEELVLYIKIILSNQWSCFIPNKLPVFLPAQKALPQLVTQAPDVVAMDVACI